MKYILWTENDQELLQDRLGYKIWSADVLMNLGPNFPRGRLIRAANGYGRRSRLEENIQCTHFKIAAAMQNTFEEATAYAKVLPDTHSLSAPAFYYADSQKGEAAGWVILPHAEQPAVEVTFMGYVLDYSVLSAGRDYLGQYFLRLGLQYQGKDREFQPSKPKKLSFQERVKAAWKGHPDTHKEKIPFLYNNYGAEIIAGVLVYGDGFKEYRASQLKINDERVEKIAREMHQSIQDKLKGE